MRTEARCLSGNPLFGGEGPMSTAACLREQPTMPHSLLRRCQRQHRQDPE